jgi:penicillin-binding protein 2
VYFYTMGQRLGVDRIHEYAHDLFGFGEPVGLEGFDESSGLVPSTKWKATYFRNAEDKKWYPGETLPVSIGQGAVLTTPLQVARAMAALVNGGKLLKPRLVSKVVASDGRILEQASDAPNVMRVIDVDPSILAEIKRGMIGVVEDKRGTGKRAALPKDSGIGVGGKTGTAQVASRESGLNHEDHAWFAGFAPTENPQIIVVALIENGGHGGEVAAPVTRAVFKQFFGVQDPIVEATTTAKKVSSKKLAQRAQPQGSISQ